MPDGGRFRTTATPYLCTKGAPEAILFYTRAFEAVETIRLLDDAGRVEYAEMMIGSARIMLADEFPEINVLSPQTLGGSAVTIVLHVTNADATANRAVAAGMEVLIPMADTPFGVRLGKFRDPFGHIWMIGAPTAPH